MAWRVAKSLEVLRAEVQSISPDTEFGTIGDPTHQAEASDHNPNAAGVVCALDIMAGHGLDLGAVAEQVRVSGHPDLKYVIYDYRIASTSHGLQWRPYTGSNPHTDHAHVSVGVGPDGQSVQPYDDTNSWGIAPKEDDMRLVATPGGTVWLLEGQVDDAGKPYLWAPTYAAVQQYQMAGVPTTKTSAELDLAFFHRMPDGAVPPGTTPPGVNPPAGLSSADIAAIAKAVNDDAAARLAE